jgi:hypothetical protein
MTHAVVVAVLGGIRRKNIMPTKVAMLTKQDVPTLSQISGMWADVMQKGLEADNNQNDAEWWLEHQKEIVFTFKVLAGLGLTYQRGKTKDGKLLWVLSNSMKRLHRYGWQHYRYRSARDKHLQKDLAFQYALLDDME